jgi:single-strand DNA-binding protein
MAGIARVILVGNLTRDPEVRYTAGGMAVCEFGIAVNSREKKDQQWQDRVDYFDVKCFGNQGEAVGNHLHRGSPAGVDGRLRQERWDAQDGSKRSKVVVIADSVQFLPSGDRSGSGSAARSSAESIPDGEFSTGADVDFQGSDDDIPFAFLDRCPLDGVVWANVRCTWPSPKLHLW